MWQSGVLGDENGTQLCGMVMYLLGVNLALRGSVEIKRLRRPGFQEKIVNHVDEAWFECLKIVEDVKSKTNLGGLKRKHHSPKSVHI